MRRHGSDEHHRRLLRRWRCVCGERHSADRYLHFRDQALTPVRDIRDYPGLRARHP